MSDNSDISFLDEAFLRRLEQLRILSKKGLKGHLKGEHISWRSGASLDFLDYRKYQVGDDFRYIDWNVYGRLDKLFIKLFRAEEDLSIHFLMDVSRSMAFGASPKDHYAKKITAALAYIGLANQDRVGLTCFNDRLVEPMRPERGKTVYPALLKRLLSIESTGATDFNAALIEHAAACRRSGMVVVLSDLFDPKGVTRGLDALVHGKFDVTLIHVVDHEELFPRLSGDLVLRDVETDKQIKATVDSELLDSHRKKMDGLISDIQTYCLDHGFGYYLCDTRIPFESFLLDYLTREIRFY